MVLFRVINYTHSSAEFGSVASQQKDAGLIATAFVSFSILHRGGN